jgi:hypothetical protein
VGYICGVFDVLDAKDEEIDGTTFFELNALHLHRMGISMGQAIKLQKVIKNAKVCKTI